MLDLDAIKARIPAEYIGWYVERGSNGELLVGYATDNPLAGLVATVPDYGYELAEFIAHAREDVPALLAEVERLRYLLGELTDPDPCSFDHDGGCQAHGFLSLKPGERCPVAEARELLGGGA